MSTDYQHSIEKTRELECSEKHTNSDDESIKQVHESLRKLEHTYLKHDDKQISFFDSLYDGKRLYEKSIQFVCLFYVYDHFAN